VTAKAEAIPHQEVKWHDIDWRKAHRMVRRLQIRIVKAIQAGDHRKAEALQRLLTHSFYAKALAVKQVTENKGRNTAGIDGVKWNTPQAKIKAIEALQHKGYKPLPLRKHLIPKGKGKGKGYRQLGIPTMKDRAMQALWLLALEPIAECILDPNYYGFRKERNCADAIKQCYNLLAKEGSAEWILEVDIQKCFDRIRHAWLEANIPMNKKTLRKWLKAGFMSKGKLYPTEEGTPQGSIISPCLANLTLNGLESALRRRFGKPTLLDRKNKVYTVFYADDFIITGTSKELLEKEVKPFVEEFLRERGLEISPEKTRITHISEGFDFLGQNIRKYKGKFLTKPSKKSQKALLQKVRTLTRELTGSTQELLILKLNQLITGWANYHRHVVSKKIFERMDHEIWQAVWRWSRRRHSNKGKRWIKRRYFRIIDHRDWTFACDQIDDNGKKHVYKLKRMAKVPITRHIKIRGEVNPFDPKWELYLEQRFQRQTEEKIQGKKRHLALYKRQKGICPQCGQKLDEETEWHIHHVIRKVEGGKNTLDNLTLLHPNCHRQIHARKTTDCVAGSLETVALDEA
jgi:RNA-directed DNA polymerase